MSKLPGLDCRGRTVGHDSDNEVQNCGGTEAGQRGPVAPVFISVDDHQVVIKPMHSSPIGHLGHLARCCLPVFHGPAFTKAAGTPTTDWLRARFPGGAGDLPARAVTEGSAQRARRRPRLRLLRPSLPARRRSLPRNGQPSRCPPMRCGRIYGACISALPRKRTGTAISPGRTLLLPRASVFPSRNT